jgi:hypothetical protein
MRLDFLVMGAQKSGTTALAYFLMQHPEIYIPEDKEIHFFDYEPHFEHRGPVDYTKYHEYFDVPSGARVVGEATPIYMYWRPARERIKQYNPSIKMVFILRNPIDRAYSHFRWFQRMTGKQGSNFSVALRLERIRRLRAYPRQTRQYSYIDRGYYARQIRRLLEQFSASQMLFIKTEDLRDNHESTLYRVFDFLGVSRVSNIEPARVNDNQYPPMSESDRMYLLKKFEKDIRDLEKLLSWDCSDWLTPPQ